MSLTRLGGILLIAGSLVSAILAVLASRGDAVGLGGTDVNGQYTLAALVLIAGGAAALAFGRVPPFGARSTRAGAMLLAVGLLLMAAASVTAADAALALAFGGVFVTAIGFLTLGAALIRSPGAGRWIGAAMLAGVILAIVGTLGPHDIQPLVLVGIVVAMASIAVLGILAIRPGLRAAG